MSPVLHKVIFTGEIKEGFSVDDVQSHLSATFKMPREKVQKIFTGQPVTVKENVERSVAEKYKEAFDAAGAICEIQTIAPNNNIVTPLSPAPEKDSPVGNTLYIAGFWGRILALVIDSILLGSFGLLLGFLFFDSFAQLGQFGRLIGFAIAITYFSLLNSTSGGGQTVGKRIVNIRVVDADDGSLITLPKSLLRHLLFTLPFFCNGLVMTSITLPLSLLLVLIVFGAGGLLFYLYVFNRSTRQSLHDLAANSIVITNKVGNKRFLPGVWRGHVVIACLWVLFVMGGTIYGVPVLTSANDFNELVVLQQQIMESENIHSASVVNGTNYSDGNEIYWTAIKVVVQSRGMLSEETASNIARTTLSMYPSVKKKALLQVAILYGYDIGISSGWESSNYNYPPDKWAALVGSESGTLSSNVSTDNNFGIVASGATVSDVRTIIGGNNKEATGVRCESGDYTFGFEGPHASDIVYAINVTRDHVITGGWDTNIKVWDKKSGYVVKTLHGHEKAIDEIKVSPNGKHMASISIYGQVILWGLPEYKKISENNLGANMTYGGVEFSPNGEFVITGDGMGNIIFMSLPSLEVVRKIETDPLRKDQPGSGIEDVELSLDGGAIVTAHGGNYLKSWSVKSGELLNEFWGHQEGVNCVEFINDGRHMVSGGRSGDVILWDFKNGLKVQSLEGAQGQIVSIGYERDDDVIIATTGRGFVYGWALGNNKMVGSMASLPGGAMGTLAVDHEQRSMFFTHDTSIYKIDFEAKEFRGFSSYDIDKTTAVTMSKDNALLFSSHADGTINCWNLVSNSLVWSNKEIGNVPLDIVLLESRDALLLSFMDGSVKQYSIFDGQLINSIKMHNDTVSSIDISNDEKYILSGSMDGYAVLYDVIEDNIIYKVQHSSSVYKVKIFDDLGLFSAITRTGRVYSYSFVSGQMEKSYNLTDDIAFYDSGIVYLLDKRVYRKSFVDGQDELMFEEDYLPEGLEVSRDGNVLLTFSNNYKRNNSFVYHLRSHNISNGENSNYYDEKRGVSYISNIGMNEYIIIGKNDGVIEFYSMDTMSLIKSFHFINKDIWMISHSGVGYFSSYGVDQLVNVSHKRDGLVQSDNNCTYNLNDKNISNIEIIKIQRDREKLLSEVSEAKKQNRATIARENISSGNAAQIITSTVSEPFNYIQNGDAETGDLSSWVPQRNLGWVEDVDGNHFFAMKIYSIIGQEVLIEPDKSHFALLLGDISFDRLPEGNDNPRIQVDFYKNGNEEKVGTRLIKSAADEPYEWSTCYGIFPIEKNHNKVVVKMFRNGVRVNDDVARFDNIKLYFFNSRSDATNFAEIYANARTSVQ